MSVKSLLFNDRIKPKNLFVKKERIMSVNCSKIQLIFLMLPVAIHSCILVFTFNVILICYTYKIEIDHT